MPEAFHGRPGGNYTCSNCGAVYEVSYVRLPNREVDKAICDCCAEELASWNDTVIPKFKLIRSSDAHKAGESGPVV